MPNRLLVGTLEEAHRVGTEVLVVDQNDVPVQIQVVLSFMLEERHW